MQKNMKKKLQGFGSWYIVDWVIGKNLINENIKISKVRYNKRKTLNKK